MSRIVTLPIPSSWYCAAFSDELKSGTVRARKIAGRDVVIFRTLSGRACVMDAFCPHLGAHLGIGGKVVEETIQCPFHGFRFDVEGGCTATGYGTKPPPTARTRVWRTQEIAGMVFVWYDPRDTPPTWELPSIETAGWSPIVSRVLDLRDHPQETVENGVDIGHFGFVHGYSEVKVCSDLQVDGPVFRVTYAAQRPMPLLGRTGASVTFEFNLEIHGLGFSMVTVHVPQYNLTTRLFITASPTVEGRIDFGLALSLKQIESRRSVHPLAVLLPRGLLEYGIARIIHGALIHDVYQDKDIWENKRFLHPPALAEGDGPVGRFRAWARQFYGDDPLVDLVRPGPQGATNGRDALATGETTAAG